MYKFSIINLIIKYPSVKKIYFCSIVPFF